MADEYGLPVRIGHNVRLNSTVFGGFVRLMLDAFDQKFGYEPTARFMLHPFGPGLPDGIWTAARQTRTSGREAWSGLGVDLTSVDWPAIQTLTGWASCTRRGV
ncbi:MAG: hypothetical protein IPG67_16875 [Acidobacteria bacterium]|nr:hypothetical protein [Acidobacteriota bacterium]